MSTQTVGQMVESHHKQTWTDLVINNRDETAIPGSLQIPGVK